LLALSGYQEVEEKPLIKYAIPAPQAKDMLVNAGFRELAPIDPYLPCVSTIFIDYHIVIAQHTLAHAFKELAWYKANRRQVQSPVHAYVFSTETRNLT
jgi:hypothetical protein